MIARQVHGPRREAVRTTAARPLAVIDQLPPLAVVLPSTVLPSKSVTLAPASAVPLKVSVVNLVMLSLLDEPLSLAAARSGTDTADPLVSMVTDQRRGCRLVPRQIGGTGRNVVGATGQHAGGDRPVADCIGRGGSQHGAAFQQLHRRATSAVPVKTGVVIFVTLSLLDEPLSLAAARSGTDTADPLVSMVTTSAVDVAWFPAKSVARAVMLWAPLAEHAGGDRPVAACIGRGAPQHGAAFQQLHRRADFGRAGEDGRGDVRHVIGTGTNRCRWPRPDPAQTRPVPLVSMVTTSAVDVA